MSHFDIWTSKDCNYLIVGPVDKGYDDIEELMEVFKREGKDTSKILKKKGEFWFPLNWYKKDETNNSQD